MMKVLALKALLAASPAFAAGQALDVVGFKTVSMLIMVLAGMILIAWALRKFGPVAQFRKNLGLEILGQVPLNPRSSLALVRAGKSVLLVGVGQNGLTLLKDLTEDAAVFIERKEGDE